MNKQEKIKLIQNYLVSLKRLCNFMDKIGEFAEVKEDYFEDAYSVTSCAEDMLAQLVGDKADWISWYIWENDCGKRGMEAGELGNLKEIRSVGDLVELIG